MKKKKNRFQIQQEQKHQQFIGGAPQFLDDNFTDNITDVDLNSVDAPVFTPVIPQVETIAQVTKQFTPDTDDVVIPQSIQDIQNQQLIQQVSKAKEDEVVLDVHDAQGNLQEKVSVPIRLTKFKKVLKNAIKPIIRAQETLAEQQHLQNTIEQKIVDEVFQQATQDLNLQTKEDVSSVIEAVEEVSQALQDIPDGDTINVDDIKIVDSTKAKGDKTGYKKFKVTIKDDIGGILSELATQTKIESKGNVPHRVTDLRVIGNTNRKFLAGSPLQLTSRTFTFKPTGGTVNKSTRVLVSLSEDYMENGTVYVYIQKSRDKAIYEVPLADEEDVLWLAKFIGNYFHMEFKLANTMLKLQDRGNPMNDVIKSIIQTNDFKVAPRVEKEKIVGFTCKSNMGGKTDWLKVGVAKSSTDGYSIYIMSDLDKDWYKYIEPGGKKEVSFNYIYDGSLLSLLYKLYNKSDWSDYGINLEEDDTKDLVMTNKLSYRELKKAYGEMYNRFVSESFSEEGDVEEEENIGIELTDTLSQIDTKRALSGNYNAEAIIGKTKYLKNFILTYLGVQIVSGDKRHGSQVITTEQYYEKYDVKDTRSYQQRQRTVLKKDEGVDRNYNARIYMFQLEYELKGKKYVYRSRDFENIKSSTGFLTSSPIATKLVE